MDRTRWTNSWTQREYQKNDIAFDNGGGSYWTMVANKTTTDRAAPQELGDPEYDVDPTFQTQSHVGVVRSGREWDVIQPVILKEYQVYVPAKTADTQYAVFTYTHPTGEPEKVQFRQVPEPQLLANQWVTVARSDALVTPGTTIGLVLDALNSGSTTLVGPYDWGRGANANDGNPVSGDWNRRNQNDVVRIHKLDDGGVNRGQDGDGSLEGIIAGSIIEFINKVDATQSVSYITTGAAFYDGTVYEFPVSLQDIGTNGEPGTGTVCVTNITVPIPSATEFSTQTGANPSGNSRGVLEFDSVPQSRETDAFGVRILWDQMTTSDDWDALAITGGTVISAAGDATDPGVTTFLGLTDTPSAYTGMAGQVVAVNSAATGLEFVPGGGDFVSKSGDTMTGTLQIDVTGQALDNYLDLSADGTRAAAVRLNNPEGTGDPIVMFGRAADGDKALVGNASWVGQQVFRGEWTQEATSWPGQWKFDNGNVSNILFMRDPNQIAAIGHTGARLGVRSNGDHETNTTSAMFDKAGAVIPANATSVATREKGDARWLRKDANSVSDGSNTISGHRMLGRSGGSASAPTFSLEAQGSGAGLYWSSSDSYPAISRSGSLVATFGDTSNTSHEWHTVMTRRKADARFQAASSLRFKEQVDETPRPLALSEDLLGETLDQIQTHTWIWGGDELPAEDERYGELGFGMIAEELQALLPAAIRMQWLDDGSGKKQVLGIDPLAMIALLVENVKQLRARVSELEGGTSP